MNQNDQRHNASQLFREKTTDIAEALARFRAQEEKRRHVFRTEIAKYLPHEVARKFAEAPPLIQISVAKAGDGAVVLPELTREDVAGINNGKFLFFSIQ
jgi:hypothetical protein